MLGKHYTHSIQSHQYEGAKRQPIHRINVNFKEKKLKKYNLKQNSFVNKTSRGYQDVYDISVKDNHNFILADNLILAHNCVNWSFFLYNVIREIFVHLKKWDNISWRLIVNRGNVNRYGAIASGGEHHIYLSWVAVKDDKEYTVESTYKPKMARELFLKKEQKVNTAYGVISYSWNEKLMISRHWI